jgi:hypothetical protein
MPLLTGVDLVQLEFFAVAALMSASLFSIGFLLGRVSMKGGTVKVPMEVIHALAAPRFEASQRNFRPAANESKHDKILHAVEAVLDHVKHEKDFKKAKEYALHEIEKIAHDHGETPELHDLHDKVDHAHNKAEIETALQEFIDHAKSHH